MTANGRYRDAEESRPLTQALDETPVRESLDSVSSVSTSSLIFERLLEPVNNGHDRIDGFPQGGDLPPDRRSKDQTSAPDLEDAAYASQTAKPVTRRTRLFMIIFGVVFLGSWLVAFAVFSSRRAGAVQNSKTPVSGSGKKITLDEVLGGLWRAQTHAISWIEGANGEDGLLLEKGGWKGKDYLVVEDVRSRSKNHTLVTHDSKTLMKDNFLVVDGKTVYPSDVWPSRNLESVLVISGKQSVSHLERESFEAMLTIAELAAFIPRPILNP